MNSTPSFSWLYGRKRGVPCETCSEPIGEYQVKRNREFGRHMDCDFCETERWKREQRY